MTRRDYIAISDAIRSTLDTSDFQNLDTTLRIAQSIAAKMEQDDPNFDRALFIANSMTQRMV